MKEIHVHTDNVTVQEFTHPNGDRGTLLALSLLEEELATLYGIDHDGEGAVVMPLKHKADGATNFHDYTESDDGEVTIEHTDEQYEEVRERLKVML